MPRVWPRIHFRFNFKTTRSLIAPSALNMPQKAPVGLVPDPLPMTPREETSVVKNAEVNMNIPKNPLPINPLPPTPAKFFPDPVAKEPDTVTKIPPPLQETSASNQEKSQEKSISSPFSASSATNTLLQDKNGISAETSDHSKFAYPYYLSNIEHKIATHWAPPPATVSAKQKQTIAVIGFTIKQDGRIDINSIVVEKSSGNAFFNMAALRAIHNANPMPPLPRGISDELRVHFTFAVGGDS